MNDIRKQLDELMGSNRNGDKPMSIVQHFSDDRVCKYDLCGLCPYQLFPNTKQDLGKCPREVCPVPDKFKDEYRKARLTQDFGYERELIVFLNGKVGQCDEQIFKKKKQLEQRGAVNHQNEPEELIKIRTELDDMTNKIEELGTEGLIDEAIEMIEKIELKKKEKESYEVKLPKEQQLLICEVCAATLSSNETDQRLSDHFAGKAHLGFQKIRDKIKMLMSEYPDLLKVKSMTPPIEPMVDKTDVANPSNQIPRDEFRRDDRRVDSMNLAEVGKLGRVAV
jgi:RNA-binding protein Luc7-like 2